MAISTEVKDNVRFEADRNWVEQLVAQAQLRRFHGKLVLNFQQGAIKQINKEESILNPHLSPPQQMIVDR